MNEFPSAATVRAHRPLLLALEAVGWLHMAGKARIEFLREQAGQKSGYDDRRWHEKESPPFPWHDLLDWAKSRYATVGAAGVGWPDAFTDFLTKHRDRGASGLLGLLQAGHAMASGIEKNLPRASCDYLGQDVTHLWQSSVFGQPARNLLLDPPEILTEAGWRRLLAEIRRILEELKSLGTGGTTDWEAWQRWREAAMGPHTFLRRALSSTLAETRLPNNDVTLWDQSYVAAALFKSAVAGAVLEGSGFPWADTAAKQRTRWRLLSVGIGADHYEERAVRIGDWTGTRLALDDFFAKVRSLVEVDLGMGSLLYRDGAVQVFSFPEERSNGGVKPREAGPWQAWLQGVIDGFARDLDLETPPHCRISEPTRSLVPMTEEIREVKAILAVPLHRAWSVANSAGNGHVCPVCLVRHTGNTNDRKAPCRPCEDRRTRRLDPWLQGRFGEDTIWIDEVADSNDRVALITLSLDIEPWLDGTRLDALRTQAIPEWRQFNPMLGVKANPIEPDHPFASLVEYVKGKLSAGYDTQDPVLRGLQDGYQHERDWSTFFGKVVEDRSQAPSWDRLDADRRAQWLAHQLFRKLASPGRVHRFWQQAEEFFTRLLMEFREAASREANRWRTRRLVLDPDDASKTGWQDREVYSGHWSARPVAPLVLLYRAQTGSFVTASNLARLLSAHDPKATLKDAAIALRADDGVERVLRVGQVRDDAGVLGVYHPVIPVELNPVRFRVLVPLDTTSACVDRAVELWTEQCARVCDRLPLRVGVVAFSRMTPFQAVIEAARNIEDVLEGVRPERWRVVERHARDGVVALYLRRAGAAGSSELHMVPVTVPDGRTDVFYPYFAVEDRELRFPLDFQHPDGQVYRHALDLRAGDEICIHPGRVGSVFLEGTAKRFEEPATRPLADWRRMRDIWQLVARTSPSLAALHGAWAELSGRHESWRTPDGEWLGDGRRVWTDLVRSVLRDRLEVDGAALDALVEAAEDGVLGWALEWHLSALKERIPEVAHGR